MSYQRSVGCDRRSGGAVWTVAIALALLAVVPVRADGGPTICIADRCCPVVVPSGYDAETPTPLIINLHGYSGTGTLNEGWMQFSARAEEYGFLYLFPDGTVDEAGNHFWNATDVCCDFDGSGVDDVEYLSALIDAMKTDYNVDPRRVYFVGHSNGGFMSYRMACDRADTVAAIASLAGVTWLDPADCDPEEPVSTLQIHGDTDPIILYGGGCLFEICYPGAVETTEQWAAFNSCELVGTPGPETYDIDGDIPGEETTVIRYITGCDPGRTSELWTMAGGRHNPNLTPEFSRLVVEWLLAHPKPAACPADLDGSGDVGFGDILAILSAWGNKGGPEDLDGSGTVDFGDILVVLGAWGPCE